MNFGSKGVPKNNPTYPEMPENNSKYPEIPGDTRKYKKTYLLRKLLPGNPQIISSKT
jgi:hypothetical protein